MKAVAFDMDGLMFDTEDVYRKAADTLLGKRGFEYTDELCAEIMGRPPRYCFERFKEVYALPESWQELQRESEDLFLEFLDDGFSPMPGLFELLDLLEEKRIPKAVCTSSSRRVAMEVLGRHKLVGRFQFILTSEDITRGKPDPEIYLKAIERFNIESTEMLVLEDSVAGSRAARDAGAFPVVVEAEHNAGGDFRAASFVVRRLNARKILDLLTGTV